MPTYAYKCEKCGLAYEEIRSINGALPSDCPKCHTAYGDGFEQDYSQSYGIGIVYGNPTTVGQQAELNAKKMGKEQLELAVQAELATRDCSGLKPRAGNARLERPKSNELPWWRNGETPGLPKSEKPIDASKIKDKKRYIETGETS